MNLREKMCQIQKGNRTAFEEVYHELKRPVFTVAFRIVKSQEMAADITQEVFVKIFRGYPDPSVENPKAWIFRMTRNLAIDTLRKQKTVDIEAGEVAGPDAFGRVAERMDLERAIGNLGCLEREILSMHLNAGLSFREVGDIVGLSLPAVYRRYRGALKQLKKELEGNAQ